MDNKEREKSALGRFEIIAERYIYGTELKKELNNLKSCLDDEMLDLAEKEAQFRGDRKTVDYIFRYRREKRGTK